MIINKKARQYCLASVKIVQFVTPNPQSSNFLIQDLEEISEFITEHQTLLIAC